MTTRQDTYNYVFASRNKLSGWINVNRDKHHPDVIKQIADRRDQLDSDLFDLNRGTPSEERMQQMQNNATEFLAMCGLN